MKYLQAWKKSLPCCLHKLCRDEHFSQGIDAVPCVFLIINFDIKIIWRR